MIRWHNYKIRLTRRYLQRSLTFDWLECVWWGIERERLWRCLILASKERSYNVDSSYTETILSPCRPLSRLSPAPMFHSGGIQQQVFQRPKAEQVFRPWWDFIEDCVLSTMLAIGRIFNHERRHAAGVVWSLKSSWSFLSPTFQFSTPPRDVCTLNWSMFNCNIDIV